jgi:prepilin-type N-terminal cleavage/methylation domain-containing protein
MFDVRCSMFDVPQVHGERGIYAASSWRRREIQEFSGQAPLGRLKRRERRAPVAIENRKSEIVNARGFSLIEVMLVVSLLGLIVLALMAVFNSTQKAFRASVTQTDVLEGGRATMDMMAADLRQMTASEGGGSWNSWNSFSNGYFMANAVNFYAYTNFDYGQPLANTLPGSGATRTNLLENIFILGQNNLNGHPAWVGTGYAVFPGATNDFYPLYRYYVTTNVEETPNPVVLFNTFLANVETPLGYTNLNWSHLLDGVVDLRVRIYNHQGYWMTYPNTNLLILTNGATFLPPAWGEAGFYLFSNALPASVEVQMGVLEDNVIQRAGTWPNGSVAQNNFLSGQAGGLHIFRQRVMIPNVDLSAYP